MFGDSGVLQKFFLLVSVCWNGDWEVDSSSGEHDSSPQTDSLPVSHAQSWIWLVVGAVVVCVSVNISEEADLRSPAEHKALLSLGVSVWIYFIFVVQTNLTEFHFPVNQTWRKSCRKQTWIRSVSIEGLKWINSVCGVTRGGAVGYVVCWCDSVKEVVLLTGYKPGGGKNSCGGHPQEENLGYYIISGIWHHLWDMTSSLGYYIISGILHHLWDMTSSSELLWPHRFHLFCFFFILILILFKSIFCSRFQNSGTK